MSREVYRKARGGTRWKKGEDMLSNLCCILFSSSMWCSPCHAQFGFVTSKYLLFCLFSPHSLPSRLLLLSTFWGLWALTAYNLSMHMFHSCQQQARGGREIKRERGRERQRPHTHHINHKRLLDFSHNHRPPAHAHLNSQLSIGTHSPPSPSPSPACTPPCTPLSCKRQFAPSHFT